MCGGGAKQIIIITPHSVECYSLLRLSKKTIKRYRQGVTREKCKTKRLLHNEEVHFMKTILMQNINEIRTF